MARLDRFVQRTSSCIGLPAVWSRKTCWKFASSSGVKLIKGLRPALFSLTIRFQFVVSCDLEQSSLNSFRIAVQELTDVGQAAMSKFCGFNGGVSAFVTFIQGFVKLLHEALDFGWVRLHGWVDRKPTGTNCKIGKLFRTKS